ncbi:MCE family protein [Gordonia crocea]|uniref:Putative Mce family protein n=1 Tax=Gordonia crocea TaxID=589162 RepID=A0A7M3SVN9_9ACTN|nr:MCE family protein [Gordonia crocea]GED96713.1 putative Mce family protein [Gordonia crocea]
MKTKLGLASKLGAFAALVVVCAVLIVNSILTPVEGDKHDFTAVITDVSGLYPGSDVRMSGVQIGKVVDIKLDGTVAKVKFDVTTDRTIYDNTRVAVRYQNLVGQRYLELLRAEKDGAPLPPDSTIPVQLTVPSFDVSRLFNGLQPLFTTLDPAAFNTLGQNLLRVIQGDGSGIGPALRDVRALADLATDRQKVVSILIANLAIVSQEIGGKSAQVGKFVQQLNTIVGNLANRADGIIASSLTANETLTRGADLLDQLQEAYDDSYDPLHQFLHRIFPPTALIAQALELLPSLISGFNNSFRTTTAPTEFHCHRGRADIPGIGRLVLGNQRLVVCR